MKLQIECDGLSQSMTANLTAIVQLLKYDALGGHLKGNVLLEIAHDAPFVTDNLPEAVMTLLEVLRYVILTSDEKEISKLIYDHPEAWRHLGRTLLEVKGKIEEHISESVTHETTD